MAYNDEMFPSTAMANKHTVVWTGQNLLHAMQSNLAGAIVVTSTVRAARALRQSYGQRQQAVGNAGWMAPRILAWQPWLETLWEASILAGAETRVLLTDLQELELWNKVLEQDATANRTLSIDGLAEQAQRAWKQMHQYRIPLARLRGDTGLDAKAFTTWATEFEKLCRKSSYLSPSLAEAAIAHSIATQEMALAEQMFLVGFDRVTPAQMSLIDSVAARGCAVQFVKLQPEENTESDRSIVCADTIEDEIESAARWVRHTLLENPSQRIGIIVPSLETMRGAIDRTFRRVLAPSSMDIRARNANLPYEFSLGTAMARLQPIRTALTLLRWIGSPIPAEEVSWLLVHGGFSGTPNAQAENIRARLDRRFRERDFQLGGPVSLTSFLQWLSRSTNSGESSAQQRTVERLSIAAQRYGMEKPRSFVEWSEIIQDLLTTAEWHLLEPSNSAEYQQLRRWNALLAELSSLSSVTGPTRFAVALARLEHLAAQMLFTLETRNAPVQILGVSESAGLSFDTVWWMNAQASVWPPRGKALPFLPWVLQREAHMPYADPMTDHAFALHTTKRILHSGKTAVVSFALQDSDPANASAHIPDREIILSPLLREILPDVAIVAAAEFLHASPEVFAISTESALETIREEPAVPFQGTTIRGGVRFLELHAACPFRAFAELRLGTRPLQEPDAGLSPGAQGTIVHRVLEHFWKEMQSQKNLLATTTEQHREILRRHIDQALAEFFQHASEPWQQTLLQIEAERLEQRLLAWLEQEKQRADFTVLTTEDELDRPQLGGIGFQCRVDRIDQVDKGIVLLDYKTGPVDRNACEGERPDQPQLPAYAILRSQTSDSENKLAGVAFAGLHPRKVGFTIVGSRPSIFSSPSNNVDADAPSEASLKSRWNSAALMDEEMQSQQAAWGATLTRLAEDFRAGIATVDPKKHAETCAYCKQSLLCRIRETAGINENSAEREIDTNSFPTKP